MFPRGALSAIFFSTLALVGCGGASDAPPAVKVLPTVRVALVGTTVASPMIQAIGTAVWRQETPLGFTSDGQISRILVNEGDIVRRGQLLATLDTTPIAAELSVAQSEARRSQSELARLAHLHRNGWVTKQRLETAQAASEVSAAQVRARRFAVQTAQVIAPSSGVVLARLAEPTQVIAKGSPVVVIGETDGGYVIRVPVNDRVAASLTMGEPALVRFEALGSTPLQGRIVEIGGRARQTTGTFDVEISLPNAPGLRSGMIGTAMLARAPRGASPAITLPAIAILAPRAGEGLVYVVDATGTARLRQVTLGDTKDTGIEILSGVKKGERIALSGFDKIRDGMRVNAVMRTP